MTLERETSVILAALLLTLITTPFVVLRIGRFILTVVVTGLLTRRMWWVLVVLVDLPMVSCLILATLEGTVTSMCGPTRQHSVAVPPTKQWSTLLATQKLVTMLLPNGWTVAMELGAWFSTCPVLLFMVRIPLFPIVMIEGLCRMTFRLPMPIRAPVAFRLTLTLQEKSPITPRKKDDTKNQRTKVQFRDSWRRNVLSPFPYGIENSVSGLGSWDNFA